MSSALAAQWYQGPTGGAGGAPFDFWEDGGHSREIRSIGIRFNDDQAILCLSIIYNERPAVAYRSTPQCRDLDPFVIHSRQVSLAEGEYLVGVDGTYGQFVNSIRFHTNRQTTETWGTPSGIAFGYTAPDGQRIVALTGRAGERIDAIGVMYAPIRQRFRPDADVPQPQPEG